jgi:5-hydroxyisourate hydrolase-like protein (transthyretin family)
MRNPLVLLFVWTVGVVTLAGCGGAAKKPVEDLVPASGIVLISGKPEAGVQVTFIPTKENAKSHGGSAVTDDSGEFKMRNYMNRSGVPVGDYIVTFSMGASERDSAMVDGKPIPGVTVKEKIPAKWSDPQKSGKHNKITVPEGGVTDLSFKITSN